MTQGFRWPGLKVYNPVQSYGFKINFLRDSFSESATGFFATMLKFILSPIFDIKIYQKKIPRGKTTTAAPRSYRQRRNYLTSTAWELKSIQQECIYRHFLLILEVAK